MTLEEVLNQWTIDSLIEKTDLDEVSRKTPALHAKYLSLLVNAKLKMKKQEMDQKTLLKEKWLWYNGKMTEEKIKELYPDLVNRYKICTKLVNGKLSVTYDWRAFHRDYSWLVINKVYI